ncbi:DsrE/DsrF/DrsH-like family protein [Tessaracoccus lubricantis]
MTEILDHPIIPDFGPARARPTNGAVATEGRARPKPADFAAPAVGTDAPNRPRKMCFIASKGNLDMAYPALIMANAALGEGIETHIFFTFWGFDLVTEATMDDLKFTMLGNTAMHLPMARSLPLWAGMGAIPGMTRLSTRMMNRQLDDLEIPGVREFLDIIVAAGGHLWGCKLSFDMNGLAMSDLYEGVEDVISAADFIELSEGGQVIFV